MAVVLIQNLNAQSPNGLQIACDAAQAIQREISQMVTDFTVNTENIERAITNITNYFNVNMQVNI